MNAETKTEIIFLEEYANMPVNQFWNKISEKFTNGIVRIDLVKGTRMIGRLISPEETKK